MTFRLANVNGLAALVSGENYYDLATLSGGALGSDPMAALQTLDKLKALSKGLSEAKPTGLVADVELGAPVPRPGSCFAIGLNYRGHAEEADMAIPETPMIFTKYPSCIVGPTAAVEMRSDYTDYEAELVAVIGKGGKNISVDDGWDHVAGLCVGQDISDRPAQFNAMPPQFNMGKSFDTFGPTGPYLVSTDALKDRNSLALTCEVNGETVQKDNVDDLIFNVPTLVSYISQLVTLQVGDMIFTGTPAGVGATQGRFLGDGDVITTSIEGLGSLTNRCVRGPDHPHADFIPPMIQALLDKQK
jgi:2-keto-4-pentenoate hydratase/2-oxohepta-3-ene-1,7-dioic acid hydratase in catechol pathway